MNDGHITVYLSRVIMTEVSDVLDRPELRQRFKTLTSERVEAFLQELRSMAVLVETLPHVFTYPRDPDDEEYVNLAVAGGAEYLVTGTTTEVVAGRGGKATRSDPLA
jgi:putative PIN family toxin of toxin-antitoxin system